MVSSRYIMRVLRQFFRLKEEKGASMSLAKITANWQITLPQEVRQQLNLKVGDKLMFSQNQNGEIIVSNASFKVLEQAQSAFSGAAQELDVSSEEDIQSLVNEVRYGKA